MEKQEDPHICCVCRKPLESGGIVSTHWGNCHRETCYPFNPALVKHLHDKEDESND